MISNWSDMMRIEYSDNYHCEHFTIDAYRFLTGNDISEYLLSGDYALPINLRNFTKLAEPKQHCIVLMRDTDKAHIGVWHDNAVLHLGDNGVVSQPLIIAQRGFKRVNFYEVKSCSH